MKKTTLKTTIKITKPIVFLCGPYISKDKREDRRIILQEELRAICGNNVLPLIIDKFLTMDNLHNDVNIEILEEIFASISDKTHVFLDTMATAVESGLFVNHMMKAKNKLIIYVPIKDEVFEQGRLGYFIRNVFIGMNIQQIELVEYHPSIRRVALSSDYVVEHFYFINNRLPKEIAEIIQDEKPIQISAELQIQKLSDLSSDPWVITYEKKQNNKLVLRTSIKLLFYVVASILYTLYGEELKESSSAKLIDFSIDEIEKNVNEAFKNYVFATAGVYGDGVELKTALNISTRDAIYYIVAFIYVYHHYATLKGIRFLNNDELFIEEMGVNPYEVFGISSEEMQVLDEVSEDYTAYYEKLTIQKRGKKRELVTYKHSIEGERLREIHLKIKDAILKKYKSDEASYAYQCGKSIIMCVSPHVKSKYFEKYDIKHFFNSIKIESLIKAIEEEFKINKKYHVITTRIVRSLFVDNKLPLGLILSPLLSDIYLKQTDLQMRVIAKEKGLVYTRYADDIMISAQDNNTSVEHIERVMENSLSRVGLRLNSTKHRSEVLDNQGIHIRYLGINIVHGLKGNYITVGKKYIYDTAKDYLEYLSLSDKSNMSLDEDNQCTYLRKRVLGRVAFIRQIDGDRGLNKLMVRVGNKAKKDDNNKLII